jgi:hypothetical protein
MTGSPFAPYFAEVELKNRKLDMSTNQGTVRVIVTVDKQHRSDVNSVVIALQTAGMNIGNVLSTAGIITGEVSQAKMQQLKTISGVADVEIDQEMQAL